MGRIDEAGGRRRTTPAGTAALSLTRHELVELVERTAGSGLSRRQLVKLFAVGGMGAVLAACERASSGGGTPGGEGASGAGGTETPGSTPGLPWVKDPDPFIQHPTNLETRIELLDGVITPNELFFVRNHAPTPRIDAASWRLRVTGDAVRREVELTLDDIRGLPSETLVAYLECAGNWRALWPEVEGRPASGGQWSRGGVSCARWSGPTLASVLELAGVTDEAVDVDLVGLDEGNFSRPMPLERAVDPTTLLAYRMNGEELPPDHGYPLRAVVPGWVGSSSVKWLGEIRVTTEKVWSKTNTTSYVLIGERWPSDRYGPADGAPITTGAVKSTLALPRPARLAAGTHTLHGFAYSPRGPVRRVEWSTDEGASWRDAGIVDPVHPHGWQRFELVWEAGPGEHVLMTRATDDAGVVQPLEAEYNAKGYLLNVVLPHPVTVA